MHFQKEKRCKLHRSSLSLFLISNSQDIGFVVQRNFALIAFYRYCLHIIGCEILGSIDDGLVAVYLAQEIGTALSLRSTHYLNSVMLNLLHTKKTGGADDGE